MLNTRQVQLWVGNDNTLSQPLAQLPKLQGAVWIGNHLPPFLTFPFFSFSQAKNLLGQEFSLIVYDARAGLNLDALAAVSGTLKQDGVLLILFSQWDSLTQWQDPDSLRWSGEEQPICTPYFLAYFQQTVRAYGFPIYQADFPSLSLSDIHQAVQESSPLPTAEQAECLKALDCADEEILIVTAKRGRGKSALAGFWAKKLWREQRPLIVTAPNKSAVNILQTFAQTALQFMPPDLLCAQIEQDPRSFSDKWLLIDEAAMIPLPLLKVLTSTFHKVLCTTTTQSYEGTGRGFLLKFKANLHRSFAHIELYQPLRWQMGDLLERFIEDLLLLQAEDTMKPPSPFALPVQIQYYAQHDLHRQQKIEPLYSLLTSAHYRTSPLDLRRLFDAPKQHIYLAESDATLVGATWLVEEGQMDSEALIWDIARGLRRPRGNLVAQLLCFQGNLPQACRLSSLRISRIAVQIPYQQQGIGQRLIAHISQHAKVDFLSVSFGYMDHLAAFWQKCGFRIVHFSEQKEASSGCYSVVALKPLTPEGRQFYLQAQRQFQRNLPFSCHPLAGLFPTPVTDWQLSEQDWVMLQHFADFHASLFACLPAIARLLAAYPDQPCPTLRHFLQRKAIAFGQPAGKKDWLQCCRQEIKKVLQNHRILL